MPVVAGEFHVAPPVAIKLVVDRKDVDYESMFDELEDKQSEELRRVWLRLVRVTCCMVLFLAIGCWGLLKY